jgi:hypothetical protein
MQQFISKLQPSSNSTHTLSTIQKGHKNELGWRIMSASTNTLPNPIPQERCADAFKHIIKKVFSYGEQGKTKGCL